MSDITKRALEQSLKNLLLRKSLNKITINDIAEDCGISRMTFYYHFKDIYDLVEWSLLEDAAKALAGKKTYGTWQEGLLNIFNMVLQNKPFIINAYAAIGREKVEQYLHSITYDLLIDVVNEQANGMNVLEKDKYYIANFYKYAFVGIMLDWVKSGMKEEPEIMVNNLNMLIQGSIRSALERFKIS